MGGSSSRPLFWSEGFILCYSKNMFTVPNGIYASLTVKTEERQILMELLVHEPKRKRITVVAVNHERD